MNSENWQPIVMYIIGVLVLIILTLIGVIFADIRKKMSDFRTNLDEHEGREERQYLQFLEHIQKLKDEVLTGLALKVQHLQNSVDHFKR